MHQFITIQSTGVTMVLLKTRLVNVPLLKIKANVVAAMPLQQLQ